MATKKGKSTTAIDRKIAAHRKAIAKVKKAKSDAKKIVKKQSLLKKLANQLSAHKKRK